MADKRELILVRLVEIAQGIEGVATVLRNQQMADDTARPSIMILDSDEVTDDRDMQPPGRTMPPGYARISMTPELYIQLGGTPEDVGTQINRFRARVLRAVLTDATIQSLCGANGIRYEACATGLSRGRSMEAECGVSFTFTYVLKTTDLDGI